VDRQPKLLDIVEALRTAPRLAGRIDGGQKKPNKDSNYCDHDQQLD
jgi:hypothetical protein